MENKLFKALVIDDEETRNETYHAVLDCRFQTEIINDIDEITKKKIREFDLVVIDVCLSKHVNELTAFKIIDDYKISKPTVLVSGEWIKNNGEPNEDILQVPKYKDVIKLISWNDFNRDGNNQRIAEEIYYEFCKRKNISTDIIDNHCTILHLSDLQFGGNEAGASCNDDSRLATFLKSKGCIPDIIVISGDITEKGRKEEYKSAQAWIETLIRDIWDIEGAIDKNYRQRIILVPGNHDYDISVGAADVFSFNFGNGVMDSFNQKNIEDVSFEHQKLGFNNFIEFARNLTLDDESWENYMQAAVHINHRFYNMGINFVQFNTVFNINSRNCENRHDLFYTDLSKITQEKMRYKAIIGDDILNIMVMHNPPEDFHRGTNSGERTKNIFQTIIEGNHVGMCLYGHSHDTVLPHEWNDNGGEWCESMICVSAPTYRLAAASRTEDANRGFNIIELAKNESGIYSKASVKSYEIVKAEISEKKVKKFDLKTDK